MTTKSKKDKDARAAAAPLRRSSSDISDELYEQQLRDQAKTYMPAAVEELADLAGTGPAAVRRQAANDLIAHGRRQAKFDMGDLHVTDGHFVVNIIQFGESQQAKEVEAKGMETIETQVVRPQLQNQIEDPPDADVTDVIPEVAGEVDPLLAMAGKASVGD